MELVANTNVLFSFFNERSKARELSTSLYLRLVSPEFALEEINEHKEDILKWFSLSDPQFSLIMKLLGRFVTFVPLKEYAKLLEESMKLSPDPDDIDFFALALKLDSPVWSNDPHFRMQSEVKVFTTGELIEELSNAR